MLYFLFFENTLSIDELLISLFLFLTAPITALFMAYLHIHPEVDEQLPNQKPATGAPTKRLAATSGRALELTPPQASFAVNPILVSA